MSGNLELRALVEKWREIAAATWPGFANDASNVNKSSANAYLHCADDLKAALSPVAGPVTDEMVERACASYWHGDWPFDRNDADRELANELRESFRRALLAALESKDEK